MISSKQLGDRIAFARAQKGLTQATVAEKLGVSRPTYIAIEKGERQPSNPELLKLATIVSVSLNQLLRDYVITSELSPRFRIKRGTEESPDVIAAVEQLRQLGAEYAELEQLIGLRRVPAPLETVNAYRPGADLRETAPELAGQDAAETVRRAFALGDGPAQRLEQRLELEAGFRIFQLDLPEKLAALLIWSDEVGACVAVNRHHLHERRRWSLSHELGHFLCDREAGDLMPSALESKLDVTERFCEALAVSLLMPAEGVRRRFAEHVRANGGRFTPADLLALAHFYEVSFSAIAFRLEELGLLPRGAYAGIHRRGFQARATEVGLSSATSASSPSDWLPERYVRLALEAFERALLSEGELAEFLHCDRIAARGIFLKSRRAHTAEGAIQVSFTENVLPSPGRRS
jgi:Zn-dependent peptidase ImmA (M78 family)/DNA-binding XRE family transcriptional regulator